MHRIFLPLYRFFEDHKALMFTLLVASTLIFAWFASKLRYEEDIIKLLPRSATSSELAFTDIGLVDKVFVQLTSRDTLNPVEPAVLGSNLAEFCEILEERDSTTHLIAGCLNSLDMETVFDAMDYAMEHIPSFVDTAWYRSIEQVITPEAIEAQMAENARIIQEDETGDATQMVVMDPLNLRGLVLQQMAEGGSVMGGFNMDDGYFFSIDKTVALAFITPSFSSMDTGQSTRFVRMINKAKKEFEASHPDIRILVHGNPQGGYSNAGTIKHDLVWTIGLSLLLILFIMIMSFHNLYFVWQQVVPVIYGALFSLACMYWIKGVMSLMALGISAIVLGVAISYCLHVLIHYYYVGDVEKMLRDESTPVFLGVITTVGAFMGLLFTESDLLRDFGLFSTFSLLGNTLFALIFLPHFLRPQQIQFKRSHGFPLVERINSLPWDRNKWVVGIMLVFIAVGIAFSPKVKFDSDLRNLDYDDPDLTESTALYNSKNSDGYVHMYFAAWDESSLDKALEYNKALFPALDSLSRLGLVKVYSPVTRLLLQSTQDQKVRIQRWEQFWNHSRVAELRSNLRHQAQVNDLPANLFDPFLNLLSAHYEPGNLFESDVYWGCLTVRYENRPYRPSDKPLIGQLGRFVLIAKRQLAARSPEGLGSLRQAVQALVEERPLDSVERDVVATANDGRNFVCIRLKLSNQLEQLPLGFVRNAVEETFPGSIVFEYHRNSVVAMLDVGKDGGDGFHATIEKGLGPFVNAMAMDAGVSNPYNDLFAAKSLFFQANQALDIGLLFEPAKRLHFFEDYALRSLVMSSVSDMRLELHYPEGLRRLVEHDDASTTSYVETLRVFLENNQSIAKTSSDLYVHRSTLMERLARIKRELGLDLDDPDVQLRLRILLKAMQSRSELRSAQERKQA